jgi:hypothetical protein
MGTYIRELDVGHCKQYKKAVIDAYDSVFNSSNIMMGRASARSILVSRWLNGQTTSEASLRRWLARRYPHQDSCVVAIRRLFLHNGYTVSRGKGLNRGKDPFAEFPFKFDTHIYRSQMQWLRDNNWSITKNDD